MTKISISLPNDVLRFVDGLDSNRSRAVVSILRRYQRKKEREATADAYAAYAEFCKDDDAGWWPAWEAASAGDIEGARGGEQK